MTFGDSSTCKNLIFGKNELFPPPLRESQYTCTVVNNQLRINIYFAIDETTEKIKFMIEVTNPPYVQDNGLIVRQIQLYTNKILGYHKTTKDTLPMIPYSLDTTNIETTIAWGVKYNTEDRLFVFYMTPATCFEKETNCLFINSVRFSIKTDVFSIQQDSVVELHLKHPTI